MTANRNKRVCPAEHSGSLDNIFRRWLQNPDKILKDHVKTGMTALDIGCGPGLFSIAMAKMTGPAGKVIAADLQDKMLNKLKNKIIGSEFEKIIKLHKTGSDSIGLSEKVDFVLAFYMVHEVPNQKNFFSEIKSILNPNAKMLLVEPKFHVSQKDFNQTLKIAAESGLKKINKKRIFLSRTAVLQSYQ